MTTILLANRKEYVTQSPGRKKGKPPYLLPASSAYIR
jgi:hypothetical protein